MNAVIARLVLRALPAPGGIRPRLANRFEGGPVAPDTERAPVAPLTATVATAPEVDGSAHSLRHDARAAEVFAPPSGTARTQPTMRSALAQTSESPPPQMPRTDDVPLEVRALSVPTPRTQPSPAQAETPERHIAEAPATAQRPLLLPPTGASANFAMAALPTLPSNPSARQPPDVEISIGRIEVRTPRTQKIERTPRARPKLMSLEDYLSRGRRTR